MISLKSFPEGYRAAVWGASGGIGAAFVAHLRDDPRCAAVSALSRSGTEASAKVRSVSYDPQSVESIQAAGNKAAEDGPLHLAIVALGTLHGETHKPEKALRQLDRDAFRHVMEVNALLPALIAQATVNTLDKERSVFTALSARVGSVSDNRLGGWHSYRASKAALNMLLRNIAIEVARKNKGAVVAGLHPGTVDSDLSAPFQGNVPEGKLFTPTYSAGAMLSVIDQWTPEQSGRCFDYAGAEIAP
ncbi:MAG: SDR family NAD(P)-dependent oxidoreductase [Pseudomonadota bacterium]